MRFTFLLLLVHPPLHLGRGVREATGPIGAIFRFRLQTAQSYQTGFGRRLDSPELPQPLPPPPRTPPTRARFTRRVNLPTVNRETTVNSAFASGLMEVKRNARMGL